MIYKEFGAYVGKKDALAGEIYLGATEQKSYSGTGPRINPASIVLPQGSAVTQPTASSTPVADASVPKKGDK